MTENTQFDVCVYSGDNKDISALPQRTTVSEGIWGKDDFLAFRKDFTNRRNGQPDTPVGKRLGALIVNCDTLIKDPTNGPCLAAFVRNARGLYAYEASLAGRA